MSFLDPLTGIRFWLKWTKSPSFSPESPVMWTPTSAVSGNLHETSLFLSFTYAVPRSVISAKHSIARSLSTGPLRLDIAASMVSTDQVI